MKFQTPNNQNNIQWPKEWFFWKFLHYASDDQDFIAPIKIKKLGGVKKKKNLLQNIKSFLIIFASFYILLCAFVLLNPRYALFFNNVLGVQYLTILTVLEYTIYVFYASFGIVLGLWFLFFWFRWLVVKTKNKRKKQNIWIIAILFLLLFFGNIYLFAKTFEWFRDNFAPDVGVIIYDNTHLKYLEAGIEQENAIIPYDQKIGPITVRYDLSSYIKKIARHEGLLLTQAYNFEIDYDGDKAPDRWSGESNWLEIPVSNIDFSPMVAPQYTYDTIGTYAPTASISGIDVWGKKIKIPLDIPIITLEKIVKIGREYLENGGIQYTFNAQELEELWQIRWSVIRDNTIIETRDGYLFVPKEVYFPPTVICLQIFKWKNPLSTHCDWKFVVEETNNSNIQNTAITTKIDSINPLQYQFSMDPKAIMGEIETIQWFIDDSLFIWKFRSGYEKIFDYTFRIPGAYKIEAEVTDTLGNKVRVGIPPVFVAKYIDLKDWYNILISNEEGDDLWKNTFDKKTKSFLLQDFPVPGILEVDATSIRANSDRFELKKVEWDTDNDGIYETEWLSIEQDIQTAGRYEIRSRSTFTDKWIDENEIPIYHLDRISFVAIQKDIDVRMKIIPEYQYAPTKVKFDASISKIKKGTIKKFIYDFGDGNVYEWEWVVATYRYTKPGDYNVSVTAVTDKWKYASRTYKLVLKKEQETVHIVPSIASGSSESNMPITFEANIQGNDTLVSWDMGDGSDLKYGQSIIHEFASPGTFTIKVVVSYSTGIEESHSIIYTIL